MQYFRQMSKILNLNISHFTKVSEDGEHNIHVPGVVFTNFTRKNNVFIKEPEYDFKLQSEMDMWSFENLSLVNTPESKLFNIDPGSQLVTILGKSSANNYVKHFLNDIANHSGILITFLEHILNDIFTQCNDIGTIQFTMDKLFQLLTDLNKMVF